MTSLRDQELPPIASIGDLVKALRLLGVGVGIDESVPTVGHELAYSLIGAAERNAIMADHRAKATGAGPGELTEFAGCTLDGAACHNDFDALALLEWRATRTTQAIQKLDLTGPSGRAPEPLLHSILLTSAALGGLLAAAGTMRNPHRPDGETRDAARALRKAIQALDQATKDAHQHELTAQLLELTD